MPEVTADKEIIRDGVPYAVLSYVLCLWILTFQYKKDNPFALFHARQGIIVFVGTFACFIFMFMPFLGVFFGIFLFVFFGASLYGIYLALTGKAEKIYIVGEIAEKIVV